MWLTRNVKYIDGVEVREPTAYQFAVLKRALDDQDVQTIITSVSELTDLKDLHYDDALLAIMDLAIDNPIKTRDDDIESNPIDWSIVLLQEADMVACRYGMSVLDVLHQYTWRQIKYIVWLGTNDRLREIKEKVAVAGGKLNNEPPPLRLKEDDGLGTAGMSAREKAAYWKARRDKV